MGMPFNGHSGSNMANQTLHQLQSVEDFPIVLFLFNCYKMEKMFRNFQLCPA